MMCVSGLRGEISLDGTSSSPTGSSVQIHIMMHENIRLKKKPDHRAEQTVI